MDPIAIIKKYYPEDSKAYPILIDHCRLVADKAIALALRHPGLNIDIQFVEEAAMVHDIGMLKTNAPGIGCYGDLQYLCHGYLGSEMIASEGFPRHALVCERHTGTGLSLEDIQSLHISLPMRDMRPVSIEEQLICFADKFYSKSTPGVEKSIEKIRQTLGRYGVRHVRRFDQWCDMFL
ncbi:MAG: HD domain-containing protein [Bacteroidales bacterium]|nr:HD domain-containing protein [Bacteroidales bacterium]